MNINLTLIGQMIAFVCFVVFCMKYVWPPIIAAMQERADKIADGLAAADRATTTSSWPKEGKGRRAPERGQGGSGSHCRLRQQARQPTGGGGQAGRAG